MRPAGAVRQCGSAATDAHDTRRIVDVDEIDSALGPDVTDLSAGELVLLLAEPQRVNDDRLSMIGGSRGSSVSSPIASLSSTSSSATFPAG